MIYADTSALVKLVTEEAESTALRHWLREHADVLVATNAVGVVELKRVAARLGPSVVAATTVLVQRLERIEVHGAAYALAAELPPTSLRTLDALHVASAAQTRDVSTFVTYDSRMAEAAALVGLTVRTPS